MIELLVGVTLSLMLIFAVVQVFDWMGTTLTNERATIELSGQLRAAAQRLQEDLDHLTCRPVTPWVDSTHAKGYFQYEEGPESDAYFANGTPRDFSAPPEPVKLLATGDRDDLLAFTVYSETPIVGRVVDFLNTGESRPIESTRAEVVWWVATVDVDGDDVADLDEPRVLLRRQFLIRPDLAVDLDTTVADDLSDIARATPGTDGVFVSEVSFGNNVFNDLGTTTWPANRMAYYLYLDPDSRNLFPSLLLIQKDQADNDRFHTLNGQRVPTLEQYGRYVVLSDVLAFDVRAYDPKAPVVVLDNANDAFAVLPSDRGYPVDTTDTEMAAVWDTSNNSRVVGRGAYVDLNYLNDNGVSILSENRESLFSGGHDFRNVGGTPYYSALKNGNGTLISSDPYPPATYTTWPLDYERDGNNQNNNSKTDEGFNGLDDDTRNGVDDLGERETIPPYPHPLRGIEVRLRVEDFSTRQIRQASVVGDFQSD